jgi:hypothetical protein
VGATSKKKTAVRLSRRASAAMFEDLIARLEGLTAWQLADVEACVRAAAEASGAALGDALMAVRVAVCGRPASPPLFESMFAIGRAVALVRLRQAASLASDPRLLQDAIAHAQADLDATRRALEAADLAVQAQVPAGAPSPAP